MRTVRLGVEWSFKDSSSLWSSCRYYPSNTLRSHIGHAYMASVLFTNCRICLYGSQASTYFSCPRLTLEEYLTRDYFESTFVNSQNVPTTQF